MSAQHTPGPWTYFYKAKYDEWHVSLPLAGQAMRLGLFADGCPTERPEADARLIAAAPDLLEACEEALGALNGAEHALPGYVVAALERAIAKAEGGKA